MARKESTESIEFPNQKIVNINMEHEVKQSFIEYSMSVIISRALPDVRDGMKPVHRRILYAMYEDHLTHDKDFYKSATTVGNVLGRYHPHGDSSVYDAMVRLAQPFSLRYPLIEGQGNFGNIDGDPAAAYRYTEARLARISNDMLSDIDKNVVNFVPNFDNRRKEPEVLPARFPNLLVNGSVGIAVGMATNIPTHNLGEVIDGTVYLMDNPDAEFPELMEHIKGPDFPTGALIYGSAGIYEAYATGRGRVIVRSRVEIDEEDHRLIVTEIPYQVNKSMLVEAIANLHKDKRVDGITGIRDESSEETGIRIVIEHRRDVSSQILLNQLYKYSQLQDTCAINMLAIVNGEPKVLGLKSILQHYIAHQVDVETRRVKFDLEKAEREAHIFEGYKIAIDNIDRVIEIIRGSMSIPDAKEQLCAEFSLSEAQAQAIVEMTLGRLSGLERQKIEDRLAALAAIIADLKGILADESKLRAIIKEDLLEIRRRYADDRRTELVPVEDEIIYEDLIEKHTCVITMTHAGYIKRQPASTYSAQRRGGKGIIGMTTKEEDFIENVSVASSHSYIMFFTNTGRVYMKKAYQIPEAGRTAKGSNIVNILELSDGEKITSGISVESFGEGEYLIMVTRRGIIKRTLLSEFEYQRRSGKRAIELDEGDELLFVRHTKGNAEIVVASHEGNFVRYREDEVRVMGRTARGVRGIKLSDDDYVTGVALVDESKQLLTVTEGGFGKRTPFDDFRVMLHRGGSGVTGHKISDKTGKLCGIATVDENDDVMMITNEGTIIRTPVSGIPVYSRTAGGVIVMRLADGASLVNFTRVEREPEDSELDEAAAADEKISDTSSVTPIDFEEAAEPVSDIEEEE